MTRSCTARPTFSAPSTAAAQPSNSLLQLHQHRAGTAATPGCGVAERVQLLRGIAQASGTVGDLRVGREHDPVGTPKCEHYRHQRLLTLQIKRLNDRQPVTLSISYFVSRLAAVPSGVEQTDPHDLGI
jgi:hypothetical protein